MQQNPFRGIYIAKTHTRIQVYRHFDIFNPKASFISEKSN